MAKLADQRYASMAEVAHDLEAVRAGDEPIALVQVKARPKQKALPEWLARVPRRNLIAAGALLLVVAIGGVAAALTSDGDLDPIERRLITAPAGLDSALRAANQLTEVTDEPAPLRGGFREVALIILPIDAEVWQADKNLGMMPVTLNVKEGDRSTIEVRRRGYASRRVTVDGSRARVVIRLVSLPPGVRDPIPPASAAQPGSIPAVAGSAAGVAVHEPPPASSAGAPEPKLPSELQAHPPPADTTPKPAASETPAPPPPAPPPAQETKAPTEPAP
jgi:hypothetical protein